jgi:hypothetical protein
MKLLDIPLDILYKNYLSLCATIPNISLYDIQKQMNETKQILKSKVRGTSTLERLWYNALALGTPDYSIYDMDAYLGEVWACWSLYARSYLRVLRSTTIINGHSFFTDLGQVRGIADLGCGCAYTTAALTELFPESVVIGTNLEQTKQMHIGRLMGEKYYFNIVGNIKLIQHPIDLVFATDYFEHFPKPVDHLKDVLNTLHPKALLLANTFNAKAIGHFDIYEIDSKIYEGKETSKLFNTILKSNGFKQVKTNFWNNRPTYWKKE